MAYKLIEAAQSRWLAVNAPHLVALVRAGAVFHKGKLLVRPIDITSQSSTAVPETAGYVPLLLMLPLACETMVYVPAASSDALFTVKALPFRTSVPWEM